MTDTTEKTVKKHCQACQKETDHWEDLGKCTECEHQHAKAMLKVSRAKNPRKRSKIIRRDPPKVRNKRAEDKREATRQEKAQAELARRELAKRHLLAFVKRYEPNYLAGWGP